MFHARHPSVNNLIALRVYDYMPMLYSISNSILSAKIEVYLTFFFGYFAIIPIF